MLFHSIAGAAGGMGGGLGGSGIGLFEIILAVGIGYLIYRIIQSRRNTTTRSYESPVNPMSQERPNNPAWQEAPSRPSGDDIARGLSHIRQMDSSFEESRFTETAADIFFKIQGAWMNRNISPIQDLLTDEARKSVQDDISALLRERKTNHLENIAVRKVEIAEAWQEEGNDFITVLFTANLLDYTTDDSTGAIVSGAKTDPVKFEEHWTLTRRVGNNPWRLSAINQVTS